MKKRVPTKHPVIDGIKTFPDGREVCMTIGAWRRRKLEVYRRDKGICQTASLTGFQPHYIDENSIYWTADHIKKRGISGATRDDRIENLRLTCDHHHDLAHDMNVHSRKESES